MHKYKGRLIIHTGSMFSGKTSALINDMRRFEIARYNTLLFKPTIDVRYSEKEVCNHDNIKMSSEIIEVGSENDILTLTRSNNAIVVGIDEAQFFDSEPLLKNIYKLLQKGITVVVAGLDMDYQAIPFDIMKELMPIADYVFKHHAVCTSCGADGWVSHRFTNEKDRITVGSSDTYKPLCRLCYDDVSKD